MLDDVESSEKFDLITVFCALWRICRRRTASNCRAASPTFSCSVNCEFPASRSGGMSAASMCPWIGGMFMLSNHQFGLKCSGLFHRLKNRHHIARRDAEGIERG